ncbi:putative O-glycosylation ligase, exosortase A system-associated [Neomegalonema sp.]|uniref:putative O-glycosylation ligase, exosortase A system-associated n=1 Tax=Neomegalonema sp. TaxID=2039713 RepID=UPI0026387DAB|nr:putative O-glycosylation ligase, exosortase A system-associated [Neomegalonema sp.]MDD2868118.1 putative O-glycosylation ligase, exosortase A system-associated [Neomegalonema sp.]
MRDLVIVLGVLAMLPFILKRPFIGVLVWTWIAILNPHREAFGFSVSLRLNLVIVLVTLIAFALSPERKQWPGGRIAALFVGFIAWTTLASLLAVDKPSSFQFWFDFVIKMAIHMILAMILITSRHRLMALVWTYALSLGYHATKIALVTIYSGGSIGQLAGFGPSGTMIEDRNHFALAMALLTPILFFIWRRAEHKLLRLGALMLIAAAILAVIGSQSRGGFVTMALVLGYLWTKTRLKWLTAGMVVVGALGIFSALPPELKERLGTITAQIDKGEDRHANEGPELDESFCLRLAAWHVGWDMTMDSPLWGSGLRSIQSPVAATPYLSPDHPCADSPKYGVRAAHNIYVEVLSDSGFVGLGMFLTLLAGSWLLCLSVMVRARRIPGMEWAADLASMVQVGLIAYAAGGVLLSLAYYDGYFLLIVMVVCADRLLREAEGRVPARRALPDETPPKAREMRRGRKPRPLRA